MFNQRIKGLLILSLGALNILVGSLLHVDWGPLSFDHRLFMFYHFSLAYLQVEIQMC